MTRFWLWGSSVLLLALLFLGGCSSGGSGPQAMTADQYLKLGQGALESVTTNPMMNVTDANNALRSAVSNYTQALAQDSNNANAKMGLALANTFLGFYDLLAVTPKQLQPSLIALVTTPVGSTSKGVHLPAAVVQAALSRATRTSAIQSIQLRIASKTLPNLLQVINLFDDVQTAVGNGAVIQLRLYQGGQIRTVTFGVADIQLVSAFSNYIAALLNLSVTFNLDMPDSNVLAPLPVDSNGDGIYEAEEYLTAPPFLGSLYKSGMASFLQYLRYAMDKATLGAGLTGHTSGPNALVDVSNTDTQAALAKMAALTSLISHACTMQVNTDQYFGDNVTRTLDLSKLTTINSLRGFMPSFQRNDLTAPGVWPDPTFNGAFVPGIPPGFFDITYDELRKAY